MLTQITAQKHPPLRVDRKIEGHAVKTPAQVAIEGIERENISCVKERIKLVLLRVPHRLRKNAQVAIEPRHHDEGSRVFCGVGLFKDVTKTRRHAGASFGV